MPRTSTSVLRACRLARGDARVAPAARREAPLRREREGREGRLVEREEEPAAERRAGPRAEPHPRAEEARAARAPQLGANLAAAAVLAPAPKPRARVGDVIQLVAQDLVEDRARLGVVARQVAVHAEELRRALLGDVQHGD